MGGTETVISAIDPHFLPEFLSLVISSLEAEYVFLYEKQGKGPVRYRCWINITQELEEWLFFRRLYPV